jgi:hypothetical protein
MRLTRPNQEWYAVYVRVLETEAGDILETSFLRWVKNPRDISLDDR